MTYNNQSVGLVNSNDTAGLNIKDMNENDLFLKFLPNLNPNSICAITALSCVSLLTISFSTALLAGSVLGFAIGINAIILSAAAALVISAIPVLVGVVAYKTNETNWKDDVEEIENKAFESKWSTESEDEWSDDDYI